MQYWVSDGNNVLSALPIDTLAERGYRIAQGLSIPNVSLGVFNLDNVGFQFGFDMPAANEPVTMGFGFGSRANPFHVGTGPFGGGAIAEADLDGFDSWAAAPARAAFSFLSASGRFAIEQGRAATLVQVTGGSARRALPGRGLWAAGSFGVRAITNAAALELRPRGIQVTLLIVDAGIQPLDGSTRPGVSPEALADPRRIAESVVFLANQDARAATHELQLTPFAENWTP